jgi:hypothetical protein
MHFTEDYIIDVYHQVYQSSCEEYSTRGTNDKNDLIFIITERIYWSLESRDPRNFDYDWIIIEKKVTKLLN